MAVNSKDIETLWKRYSEEDIKKDYSLAQYFELNGVPYHILVFDSTGESVVVNARISAPIDMNCLRFYLL